MELEDVKAYLKENEDNSEVQQLTGSKRLSFDEAMQDADFNKKVRSYADSEGNKQVDAYKLKGFKTAVEDEVAKRLKAKSHKEPWEIRQEELEANQARLEDTIRQKDLDAMRANNKANVAPALADYKLPAELVDLLISEESEKTESNIKLLTDAIQNYGQMLKQDGIKGNNIRVPGKTTSANASHKELSDAQLYELVRTDPSQKEAILSEIKRRTKA